MAAVDTVFEQLGTMSVLELVELKKKIEEEWGITAAAAVAVAAPGAGGGRRGGRGGEDGVRRRPHGRRPAEDPGDQGRPRRHRPGPQGGEGSRRRRAQPGEGRREPGRGGLHQGAARGGWRLRRGQVGRRSAGRAGVRLCPSVGSAAPAPRGVRAATLPGSVIVDPRCTLAARGSTPLSWEVRRRNPRPRLSHARFPVRPHP